MVNLSETESFEHELRRNAWTSKGPKVIDHKPFTLGLKAISLGTCEVQATPSRLGCLSWSRVAGDASLLWEAGQAQRVAAGAAR